MARAGTATAYWWGDEVSRSAPKANCDDCGAGGPAGPLPGGSFAPNPFGVYDTAGNVAEWVADCWHDTYEGAPVDGSPWLLGILLLTDHRFLEASCDRVTRGGGFRTPARALTSYDRIRLHPSRRIEYVGFRVARDL
jgi:formylglycine-generating enzyme required for sulfatase activity